MERKREHAILSGGNQSVTVIHWGVLPRRIGNP